MTVQFQAYAMVHDGDVFYRNPIGQPLHSEAAAWQAAHNIAMHFWPDDSRRRWSFIERCEVTSVTRVEIN
jgi:hypothetical protein